MTMMLIQGNFRILKNAPDGDSIRFYPHIPELWKKLQTLVSTNRSGGVQLRLDSIDALETHYRPKMGSIGIQRERWSDLMPMITWELWLARSGRCG